MAGTGIVPWEMILFWLKIAIIGMGVLGENMDKSPIQFDDSPMEKAPFTSGNFPWQPRVFWHFFPRVIKLVAMDVHQPNKNLILGLTQPYGLHGDLNFVFTRKFVEDLLEKRWICSPLGNAVNKRWLAVKSTLHRILRIIG